MINNKDNSIVPIIKKCQRYTYFIISDAFRTGCKISTYTTHDYRSEF